MNWVFALALYSNPTGHYIQEFNSEKECIVALKDFVSKNKSNNNIKYAGCISNDIIQLD